VGGLEEAERVELAWSTSSVQKTVQLSAVRTGLGECPQQSGGGSQRDVPLGLVSTDRERLGQCRLPARFGKQPALTATGFADDDSCRGAGRATPDDVPQRGQFLGPADEHVHAIERTPIRPKTGEACC
jgi:hypothetical protein